MLRALAETEISGIATTIPAAEAILSSAPFIEGRHSTRFVEEQLDLSAIAKAPPPEGTRDADGRIWSTVDAEVDGRRYRVRLWVDPHSGSHAQSPQSAPRRSSGALGIGGDRTVTVPMQGTIMSIAVSVGDIVAVDDVICVLEAMKMENPIRATVSGTIDEIRVAVGDALGPGDIVAVIA